MTGMTPPPQEPEDPELDRLLAHGRLSGPQLEHMWAALAPKVAPARRWSWAWLSFATLPVMAAAAFLLWPRAVEPLQPRGTHASLLLETSCGAPTSPCRVGQAVRLKVAAPADGVVHVLMRSQGGWEPVGTSIPVRADQPHTLEQGLLLEAPDAPGGLDVAAWWTPVAQAPAAQPPADALVRHLDVVP